MIKLLAFSGSTRRDSFNKKILKIAVSAAETTGAEITLLDLKNYPLPFYDGDLEQEKGLPENAIKLKEIIKKQDGKKFLKEFQMSKDFISPNSAKLKKLGDFLIEMTQKKELADK